MVTSHQGSTIWAIDLVETSNCWGRCRFEQGAHSGNEHQTQPFEMAKTSNLQRTAVPRYNPNDDEQHFAASIGNVSFLKKARPGRRSAVFEHEDI